MLRIVKIYFPLALLFAVEFVNSIPRIQTSKKPETTVIPTTPDTKISDEFMKLLPKFLIFLEQNNENQECPSNPSKTELYDKHFNCIKNCTCTEKVYKNCVEALAENNNLDDVYAVNLKLTNLPPFYTFCASALNRQERGWMMIQRRMDGSENFHRNWADYKHGFGDLFGEYWIGLERLSLMTAASDYELWIHLIDFDDVNRYAKYSVFSVSDEEDFYRLIVGGYNGNVGGNSMAYHNGMRFSTFDKINYNEQSNNVGSCPVTFRGGWWFKDCSLCNLNGFYFKKSDKNQLHGIEWYNWLTDSFRNSLKYTHMAIRSLK